MADKQSSFKSYSGYVELNVVVPNRKIALHTIQMASKATAKQGMCENGDKHIHQKFLNDYQKLYRDVQTKK